MFQELHWSDLLRRYVDYDQLEDAVVLTVEYVDALLWTYTGHDCPEFNLKVTSHCQHKRFMITLSSKNSNCKNTFIAKCQSMKNLRYLLYPKFKLKVYGKFYKP